MSGFKALLKYSSATLKRHEGFVPAHFAIHNFA